MVGRRDRRRHGLLAAQTVNYTTQRSIDTIVCVPALLSEKPVLKYESSRTTLSRRAHSEGRYEKSFHLTWHV